MVTTQETLGYSYHTYVVVLRTRKEISGYSYHTYVVVLGTRQILIYPHSGGMYGYHTRNLRLQLPHICCGSGNQANIDISTLRWNVWLPHKRPQVTATTHMLWFWEPGKY